MFADMMVVIVESCVRASVVLCAAWVLTSMMRHASAATRHFVWSCAIAGAILTSALGSLGPRWTVSLPQSIASTPSIFTVESPSGGFELDAPATSSIDAPEITMGTPVRSSAPASAPALDSAFVLGLAWAAGALAVLAYAFSGAVGAWLLRRSATPVHAPWVDEAQTLAEVFEIAGAIKIVESKAIAMPMVSGVWNPLIVVPPSASDWSDERRRVVVLHELAHIKRRDCLTQVVAQVVCSVYWFNPIVWLAARRLRVERERACDDFVLAAGEKGADYAAHLLDIAQTVRHGRAPAFAGLAMARPSQLEGRLLAILNPAIRRSSALHTRLASLGLVLAVTLPVGAVEFIDAAPNADATAVAMIAPSATISTPETEQPSVSPAPRQSVASRRAESPAPSPAPSPNPSPAPSPEPSPQAPHEAIVQIDASQIGAVLGETLGTQIGRQIAAALAGQASQTSAVGDPKTVEALIGALNDSDPEVREMVVVTLSRMRDPRIVTALLPLLKDSNAEVREHVVFALARSGDARAITAVAGMIDDASPDVREQAVHLLGRSRNPDALPALTKALKDSSPDVREQAAFALGQLRSANAVDPLLEALKDSSPDVREQAAFALGQTRNGRAVDGLMTALKDSNGDVREQAAFALGQIRDPKALSALTEALRDSVADVREQSAFAIGQISGQQ
jgi:HEAT repeat protein/beta-lactamase regulating signal transducer with metallopeptidase domain